MFIFVCGTEGTTSREKFLVEWIVRSEPKFGLKWTVSTEILATE